MHLLIDARLHSCGRYIQLPVHSMQVVRISVRDELRAEGGNCYTKSSTVQQMQREMVGERQIKSPRSKCQVCMYASCAAAQERERGKQILTRFNFQQLQPGILRGMQTPLLTPATCWVRVQLTWGQAWRLKAKNNHISVCKTQALSLASLFLLFLVERFTPAGHEAELWTQRHPVLLRLLITSWDQAYRESWSHLDISLCSLKPELHINNLCFLWCK